MKNTGRGFVTILAVDVQDFIDARFGILSRCTEQPDMAEACRQRIDDAGKFFCADASNSLQPTLVGCCLKLF